MNMSAITKHYDKLTIIERFALFNAAKYRGDESDMKALQRSAPRKRWEMPNTTGIIDAFDEAAQWHVMGLMHMQANYYFLLYVIDDELIKAINKKNGEDINPAQSMQRILIDAVTTCAAWRVICLEYGVDPARVLDGLPGAMSLGLFEIMARRMIEETTGEEIDPDELATSADDMRAVIELLRKRWE